MPNTIISEGKTTSEAISNGLKKLNVSKEQVDIKILEEHEKRSFFSILAPRVVKVELTVKEDSTHKPYNHRKSKNEADTKLTEEEINLIKDRLQSFFNELINNFEELKFEISLDTNSNFVYVNLDGKDAKLLIGYRGEVLNALQNILTAVASKNIDKKIRIVLNISNYREKRKVSLEELADKISKTVLKTGKSITLEPMMAYERKIIHDRLQSSTKVKTYSVGEEPFRKVVITKK